MKQKQKRQPKQSQKQAELFEASELLKPEDERQPLLTKDGIPFIVPVCTGYSYHRPNGDFEAVIEAIVKNNADTISEENVGAEPIEVTIINADGLQRFNDDNYNYAERSTKTSHILNHPDYPEKNQNKSIEDKLVKQAQDWVNKNKKTWEKYHQINVTVKHWSEVLAHSNFLPHLQNMQILFWENENFREAVFSSISPAIKRLATAATKKLQNKVNAAKEDANQKIAEANNNPTDEAKTAAVEAQKRLKIIEQQKKEFRFNFSRTKIAPNIWNAINYVLEESAAIFTWEGYLTYPQALNPAMLYLLKNYATLMKETKDEDCELTEVAIPSLTSVTAEITSHFNHSKKYKESSHHSQQKLATNEDEERLGRSPPTRASNLDSINKAGLFATTNKHKPKRPSSHSAPPPIREKLLLEDDRHVKEWLKMVSTMLQFFCRPERNTVKKITAALIEAIKVSTYDGQLNGIKKVLPTVLEGANDLITHLSKNVSGGPYSIEADLLPLLETHFRNEALAKEQSIINFTASPRNSSPAKFKVTKTNSVEPAQPPAVINNQYSPEKSSPPKGGYCGTTFSIKSDNPQPKPPLAPLVRQKAVI